MRRPWSEPCRPKGLPERARRLRTRAASPTAPLWDMPNVLILRIAPIARAIPIGSIPHAWPLSIISAATVNGQGSMNVVDKKAGY